MANLPMEDVDVQSDEPRTLFPDLLSELGRDLHAEEGLCLALLRNITCVPSLDGKMHIERKGDDPIEGKLFYWPVDQSPVQVKAFLIQWLRNGGNNPPDEQLRISLGAPARVSQTCTQRVCRALVH